MAQTNPPVADADQDWEQTSAVDPRPTWRPTAEGMEMEGTHRHVTALPPLGYPISEPAIGDWFKQTHGRVPETAEIGVILDLMARRDAEQPAAEGPTSRVFLDR